jgi:hypothetical protein
MSKKTSMLVNPVSSPAQENNPTPDDANPGTNNIPTEVNPQITSPISDQNKPMKPKGGHENPI